MEKETVRRIKYALFGLGAGFLSASLGIGGGVIIVPVLVFFLGVDIKKAVGSSLAALVPIVLVAAVSHFFIDPANTKILAAVYAVLGAMVGVKLGVVLNKVIHAKLLERLFALLLLFAAVKLSGFADAVSGQGQLHLGQVYMIFLGLFAGISSSLFGIGGGVLFVPGFYFLAGMSMREAIPSSLAAIIPTASLGAALHLREGNVDLQFMRRIVPFAIVGAVLGAVASNMIPVDVLKIALALVLLVAAVKLFTRKIKTA